MNRRWSVLVVLILLTGCAIPQNTLAQDLAWERWRACDHFASVQLDRISPDGQIWAMYRVAGEIPGWQQCLRDAARKQAARGGVAPAPDVKGVAVATPIPEFPPSLP